MDISTQYVRLCLKAKEIQALSPEGESGSWYVDGEKLGDVLGVRLTNTEKKLYKERHEGKCLIWLPSQDQLQEMFSSGMFSLDALFPLDTWSLQLSFFGFMYEVNLSTVQDETIRFERSPYAYQFCSLEQLWLAFIMKKKYNKIWVKGEWAEETGHVI